MAVLTARSAPRALDPRRLAQGRPSISFEFFPPKDDAGEAALWEAIRDLEKTRPTFVSVTYGAGGSQAATGPSG
jgi:methylenetetrahydrofolate reductase (NADPH)